MRAIAVWRNQWNSKPATRRGRPQGSESSCQRPAAARAGTHTDRKPLFVYTAPAAVGNTTLLSPTIDDCFFEHPSLPRRKGNHLDPPTLVVVARRRGHVRLAYLTRAVADSRRVVQRLADRSAKLNGLEPRQPKVLGELRVAEVKQQRPLVVPRGLDADVAGVIVPWAGRVSAGRSDRLPRPWRAQFLALFCGKSGTKSRA